jgi:hypothetical protein
MPQTVSRLVVIGSIVRTIVRGQAVWKSAENSATRKRGLLSGLDVCAGLNRRAFVPTTDSNCRDLRLELAG